MSIFANCQPHNQDIPSSLTIVCSWFLGRFDPIAIPRKGPDWLKVKCNTPSHCLYFWWKSIEPKSDQVRPTLKSSTFVWVVPKADSLFPLRLKTERPVANSHTFSEHKERFSFRLEAMLYYKPRNEEKRKLLMIIPLIHWVNTLKISTISGPPSCLSQYISSFV